MRSIWEFCFSESNNTNNITLSPHKGPAMRYGAHDITFVDYPGEYDIHGHNVICYATDALLHYIIVVDDLRYAIIQDILVLQKNSFDQIDVWVVSDESIQKEVERQELEWKITLMDDLVEQKEIA